MSVPPRNSSSAPEVRSLRWKAESTKKQSYNTSSLRSARVVADIWSKVGSTANSIGPWYRYESRSTTCIDSMSITTRVLITRVLYCSNIISSKLVRTRSLLLYPKFRRSRGTIIRTVRAIETCIPWSLIAASRRTRDEDVRGSRTGSEVRSHGGFGEWLADFRCAFLAELLLVFSFVISRALLASGGDAVSVHPVLFYWLVRGGRLRTEVAEVQWTVGEELTMLVGDVLRDCDSLAFTLRDLHDFVASEIFVGIEARGARVRIYGGIRIACAVQLVTHFFRHLTQPFVGRGCHQRTESRGFSGGFRRVGGSLREIRLRDGLVPLVGFLLVVEDARFGRSRSVRNRRLESIEGFPSNLFVQELDVLVNCSICSKM